MPLPPLRGEGERIGQKSAEIGGEAVRIGEKFLKTTCQRIGAFESVDRHLVNRSGDSGRVPVVRQPVFPTHPFGDSAGGCGQDVEVSRQCGIDYRRVDGKWRAGIAGFCCRAGGLCPRGGFAWPVARQQVIVEKVDQHAGDAPSPRADARPAGEESGMPVGIRRWRGAGRPPMPTPAAGRREAAL